MGTCAAVLWFAMLGAATQPAPPPDGSTVTATGCLRAGQETGTFVLEKITWSPASSASPADSAAHHDASPQRDRPTAPATAASGPRDLPAAGQSLRLAGAPSKLKLSEHVGHTVTVTGMLAPVDPIVRPAVVLPDAPAGGAPRKPDTASNDAMQRVLNVRSLTPVSAACK